MMNEKVKNVAIGASTVALAIVMGLQTFVFGSNDIQTLKKEMAELSERIAKLEQPVTHD